MIHYHHGPDTDRQLKSLENYDTILMRSFATLKLKIFKH